MPFSTSPPASNPSGSKSSTTRLSTTEPSITAKQSTTETQADFCCRRSRRGSSQNGFRCGCVWSKQNEFRCGCVRGSNQNEFRSGCVRGSNQNEFRSGCMRGSNQNGFRSGCIRGSNQNGFRCGCVRGSNQNGFRSGCGRDIRIIVRASTKDRTPPVASLSSAEGQLSFSSALRLSLPHCARLTLLYSVQWGLRRCERRRDAIRSHSDPGM